ncbi:hypothetical protein [Streptomyces sp. URMC 123]|uniref:hypothetical protein n=1 Tax=Streptomyces sp. URMC 123 TaxID=3423403 RepID=UPI003F1DD165
MTAQPEHSGAHSPPMGTVAELRSALSTWGLPEDLAAFEAELDAADLDDLTHVREIIQAYRHRVLMRQDLQAVAAITRTADDVEAELRRKLQETAGR